MVKDFRQLKKGFTLVELLIVIAIIALLGSALLATAGLKIQLAKARDAKRKADFKKMQNVLEDCYNDRSQYPQTDQFQCQVRFSPYLNQVPCDPLKSQSYLYMSCKNEHGYVLLANLENENDPAIEEGECRNKCEVFPLGNYNFGVFSPNMTLADISECRVPSSTCKDHLCHPPPEDLGTLCGKPGCCEKGYVLTCNGEPKCCPSLGGE